MKFVIMLLIIASVPTDAICVNIRNGIERYEIYHDALEGKRVGIVANHTSMVKEQHSVDFLRDKGVNLVRVFSPEHGFRGEAEAGRLTGDYTDAASRLEVISLYGKKKKPTAEDLKGIDLMIFDIQDVGVRFYTYISTLHYVMEACAENGIPLVVMDRPNPNAFYVDGPVLQKSYVSFVGMHPVPVVYGMTIGEYALMINGEGWLNGKRRCRLTVIPCENWKREEAVSLPQKPSPNLPDSVSVILYPSVCFFEGTVVNEGRGTMTPFQVFGHPDLKNMSYSYTPRSIKGMSESPKCEGQLCYGMDLRKEYHSVRERKKINLAWLLLAYRNYEGKESFFTPFFDQLAGNDLLRKAILSGESEEEIRNSWQPDLQAFREMRIKYLLYR